MGLLNTDLATVNARKPRNSDRIIPGEELNFRGLLDAATNVPIAGDALSGGLALYDAAKGDYGSAAMNAFGVLPFVSGMVIPTKHLDDALDRFNAMQRGENPRGVIKGGLLQTEEQTNKINDAFKELTQGKQPPYPHTPIDIGLQHIFDARISGAIKPSGKRADNFAPPHVVGMMKAAGEDWADVVTHNGKPALRGLYVDPVTGEQYGVRMPISGDMQTGRLWVSGLVPEGKYAKKKP